MRKVIKSFNAALLFMIFALYCHSQVYAAYPERPVTLVVPQAPGGASDALARILAQKLSEKWSQPVVVENRAGAGGNIGLSHVAKSRKDGYTLLMSYEGTQAINVSLYSDLQYDPVKDFVAVATIATVPFLCVVNNNVNARTFEEFISLAKSKSNMTFGSAGSGSVNHLLGEMVNLAAGTQLTHVPYKGAGPALADLLGGRITAVFTSVPSIAQQIESGKVRALAVTSADRSKQLPTVPTIAESGYTNFDVNPWFGIFAPKDTPVEIVNQINADIGVLLQSADMAKSIAAQGASPLVSTPVQFQSMLDRDIKKWATVVEKSDAKVN
jgi:tripartite-type tricarboxylate transporter receptor subunit TctC